VAWTPDIKEDEMVIMRYELVVLHGALDETTGPSVKGRKKRVSQGSGGARSTAVLICKCMDVFDHRYARAGCALQSDALY
jgi:hypothetical protein